MEKRIQCIKKDDMALQKLKKKYFVIFANFLEMNYYIYLKTDPLFPTNVHMARVNEDSMFIFELFPP